MKKSHFWPYKYLKIDNIVDKFQSDQLSISCRFNFSLDFVHKLLKLSLEGRQTFFSLLDQKTSFFFESSYLDSLYIIKFIDQFGSNSIFGLHGKKEVYSSLYKMFTVFRVGHKNCSNLCLVLQKQVPADISGIYYSGDPKDSRPDRPIIQGRWGNTFEWSDLDRKNCDTVFLDNKGNIAKFFYKSQSAIKIPFKASKGYKKVLIDKKKCGHSCLTEILVQRVFDLSRDIENIYNKKIIGIKWIYWKDHVYIEDIFLIPEMEKVDKSYDHNTWKSNYISYYSSFERESPLWGTLRKELYCRHLSWIIREKKDFFQKYITYYRGNIYINEDKFKKKISFTQKMLLQKNSRFRSSFFVLLFYLFNTFFFTKF